MALALALALALSGLALLTSLLQGSNQATLFACSDSFQ